MEVSPPIEATFSLSYAERLRAGWAMTLSSPTSLAWLSVFPVFGVILLAVLARPTSEISFVSILALLGCFGFAPFMFFFNTYSAHRADRKNGPYTYRFSEVGLQVLTPSSELKQSWDAIPHVRERLGILLIYFNKRCAHCVPLRALGGADAASAVMQVASASGVPRVGT